MKKWIRRFVMTILGLVLGTGMYMICAERVLKDPFPMPFGIGFANVVSGSMEPALKKGTLLLVRKKADAEIGDIVVYQSGESIIVHRIISAEGDQVITKGDANETEDIPIKRSQIKGVVMFKIPEIGKGIQWLQTLARYSGADHKQESAKVAAFEHGEQILQPFSRAGKTGDLQPGTDRVYALTVTNEKNGNVSETRQNYSIQVTTAGTLAFTNGITTTLGTVPTKILSAISCGAVFMGANTYIGNAPNFMVKAISDENGVKMPSFFGYMLWSVAFLIPVFVIDMFVFFL